MTTYRTGGSSASLAVRNHIRCVHRLVACSLAADGSEWAFAATHSGAIDKHWQATSVANPAFFNGRIQMMRDLKLGLEMLTGRFLEIDFKSFLYWRETGEPHVGHWLAARLRA